MQDKALAVGAGLCPCFRGLRVLGLWTSRPAPSAGCSRQCLAVASQLRTALLAVAHLVLPVTLAANFLNCRFDSLELLATNIFLFSGMTGVSSKALLFVLDKKRFEQLLLQMQQTRIRFADNSEDQVGARERCRKFATRLYYTQHSGVRFTVLLWVTLPATASILSSDPPSTRELPLPLCLPGVDLTLSPYFELGYVIQALCLFIAVEGMSLLDSSFLALMLNIAAELEVLNNNLVSLGSKKAPKNEKSSDLARRYPYSSSGRLDSNPDSDDDSYNQLLENIKHHQHIIRRARELEALMSRPTFVHLFYSLICISLSIVAFTVVLQTEGYSPKILKVIVVITAFVFQLGFFCLLGNSVIEQSERLMLSAFSCHWPDAHPRFKKALLVFMLRALHPLHIRVAKLYPLSRETFLQILNASYTLFNLVFQTNRRNGLDDPSS